MGEGGEGGKSEGGKDEEQASGADERRAPTFPRRSLRDGIMHNAGKHGNTATSTDKEMMQEREATRWNKKKGL